MIINKLIFSLALILLITACSKKIENESSIKEKSLELQVLEAYQEGKKSLEDGDSLFAAKKFNEAEILFPQSIWAPKSALMAAYAYYIQDYYGDAIAELIRFQRVYPQNNNLDYVSYLLAICYYEQIVDEKKDLQSIINAKKTFEKVIKELGIDIKIICKRIEEIAHQNEHRESYDICLSRAVSNISTLNEFSLPLLKLDGMSICIKGNHISNEIISSEYSAKILGGEMINYSTISDRSTIVVYKKIKKTPSLYPRKTGIPKKSPLELS